MAENNFTNMVRGTDSNFVDQPSTEQDYAQNASAFTDIANQCFAGEYKAQATGRSI